MPGMGYGCSLLLFLLLLSDVWDLSILLPIKTHIREELGHTVKIKYFSLSLSLFFAGYHLHSEN